MPKTVKCTLEQAQQVFADRGFILTETEYKNARTPMTYICPIHGEEKMSLDNMKRGKGCHGGRIDKLVEANITHGLARHKVWRLWQGIHSRCHNPNNPSYTNYGGRGITMCDEWRNDKEAFFKWALENGWQDGLQIDREDNNGNYEPSNCRFVDLITQANNKRTNLYLTIEGRTQTVAQWSRELGIPYEKLRLQYHGRLGK